MKETIKKIRNLLLESTRPIFLFDDDPDGLSAFLILYDLVKAGKGLPLKGNVLNETFAARNTSSIVRVSGVPSFVSIFAAICTLFQSILLPPLQLFQTNAVILDHILGNKKHSVSCATKLCFSFYFNRSDV